MMCTQVLHQMKLILLLHKKSMHAKWMCARNVTGLDISYTSQHSDFTVTSFLRIMFGKEFGCPLIDSTPNLCNMNHVKHIMLLH